MPLPPATFAPARRQRGRFVNPSGRGAQGLPSVLRWLATRRRGAWPSSVADVHVAPPLPRLDDGSIRATIVGHATVLVQVGGLNFLTDPVLSKRIGPASWLGPKRVRPPAVPFEEIPKIDVVLLSHDHYDHLDRPTLARLARRDDPLVIAGLEVGAKVPSRRVLELDWWQTHQLSARTRVTFVPSEHFSGRGPFDRDRRLWGGFVVETAAGTFYFAGDTAEGAHFAAVRERFGPMTLSLLPIGAYLPRWFMAPVHIDPAGALQASLALESQVSLAIHYATFDLADEGYDAPPRELARALEQLQGEPPGSDFRVVPFGEATVVARPGPAPAPDSTPAVAVLEAR